MKKTIKSFQGPVPEGAKVSDFRRTGMTTVKKKKEKKKKKKKAAWHKPLTSKRILKKPKRATLVLDLG